jgi:hypothetical protein
MNQKEKRLLRLYRKLSETDQLGLSRYAEYLVHSSEQGQGPESVPQPEPIPRPQDETVVAAIKRLSASYSMLDSPKLLNDTSNLMSQHVMQGKPAGEVIDELERLFEGHYQDLLDEMNATQD